MLLTGSPQNEKGILLIVPIACVYIYTWSFEFLYELYAELCTDGGDMQTRLDKAVDLTLSDRAPVR